jgi:hypothetical protein
VRSWWCEKTKRVYNEDGYHGHGLWTTHSNGPAFLACLLLHLFFPQSFLLLGMLHDFSLQKKLTVRDASQLAAHHGSENRTATVEWMSPTRTRRNSYRVIVSRVSFLRIDLRPISKLLCRVYEILDVDLKTRMLFISVEESRKPTFVFVKGNE